MKKAISVKNVSKRYTLYNNTKERLVDLITFSNRGEPFYALKNVNFEANHGEVVGFIGINGSGKSTLSNIIAGIVPETSGKVEVSGTTSLIAVAAGLKNDLTGRDNIELKLLMLGFNKEEIKSLEDDIIEFSELEKFIDQPVKSYSSGMKSRLGFSISVSVNPDILIIDEALSVGDRAFAEKSLKKMLEFKEQGKTMIFVSHSLGQMKKFCDKILWLEFGRVKDYGTVDEIIPKYQEFLDIWKKMSKEQRQNYRNQAINGNLDYCSYIKQFRKKQDESYKENLVSKIVRIRANGAPIYESPVNKKVIHFSDNFMESSYYVKKEVVYGDEKYYLISDKPSRTKGVIGWVKSSDLRSHTIIKIDNDYQEFTIKGEGSAFNRPWGKERNVVYPELKQFKGEKFYVDRTDRVGRKNYWYYGTLAEKKVWIHAHFLKDE